MVKTYIAAKLLGLGTNPNPSVRMHLKARVRVTNPNNYPSSLKSKKNQLFSKFIFFSGALSKFIICYVRNVMPISGKCQICQKWKVLPKKATWGKIPETWDLMRKDEIYPLLFYKNCKLVK